MPIPEHYYTEQAMTCFTYSYNGEGSYYCPNCFANQGSVWVNDIFRPTKFQALCDKCRKEYEPKQENTVSSTYYRLDHTVDYYNRVHLAWYTFTVLRTTAKGVWISTPHMNRLGRKFILNDARKRYAYPTKELALESFIARKARQISILQSQLDRAQDAYEKAKRVTDVNSLAVEMQDGQFTLD